MYRTQLTVGVHARMFVVGSLLASFLGCLGLVAFAAAAVLVVCGQSVLSCFYPASVNMLGEVQLACLLL